MSFVLCCCLYHSWYVNLHRNHTCCFFDQHLSKSEEYLRFQNNWRLPKGPAIQNWDVHWTIWILIMWLERRFLVLGHRNHVPKDCHHLCSWILAQNLAINAGSCIYLDNHVQHPCNHKVQAFSRERWKPTQHQKWTHLADHNVFWYNLSDKLWPRIHRRSRWYFPLVCSHHYFRSKLAIFLWLGHDHLNQFAVHCA